ncbi:MFS transporter [Nakamurella silvestris]|nr:MFS transporter [Nakamurella silvestris]
MSDDHERSTPEVTLRSIAPTAFLPPALFSIGQGAIAPVVVISAGQLGASPATAALVVAVTGIGQLVADIPAGILAARHGEKRAMLFAATLAAVALGGCMWAPHLAVFAAAMFLLGSATAVWMLARQAYVAAVVPYRLRARAMSTLGGVYRIGLFIGPFLGGAVVHFTGLAGAYAVHLVFALIAGGVLLVARDLPDPVEPTGGLPVLGTRAVVVAHRRTFSTLGTGVLLVSAVRATRQVVIPLWGLHLGLQTSTIALIFGISGAVDMLFFYPAGRVMDRLGRVAVAVPSMTVMAVAHLLLPLTHSAGTLILVGMLMGVGNGMSSGLVMTLGADYAPPDQRQRFLGVWRFMADLGNGLGPVALSGVTAAATLGVGIASFGIVGVGTAVLLWRWIPRRSRP